MVEVRSASAIETSVHIGKLNLPLPVDHSWIPLPLECWVGTCDAYSDLYSAFDMNLIEVRIQGQSEYPQWYLDVLAPSFESADVILPDHEEVVLKKILNMKATAHPVIWSVIRSVLYQAELLGACRDGVINILQPALFLAAEADDDQI